MFTDELIGLDMAHRREIRQSNALAQGIIDEQSADVALLTRTLHQALGGLKKAQAALDEETRRRMALQIEIDRLRRMLDTPIG